ncbi:hypothetical protein BDZ94DRAFT_928159 [Collybia nuda]|uniref:Uncharacterized protein n=1 Tax=Collybia nuda TaxID=64659 RepID=A0A9P6CGZ5_9AGAR|nr:hypothetical protein BDZ94DRAFT_928159 [Collybia nuda]
MGEIGARIGIFFAFNGIIGLFATPIAGALLTTEFYWWRAIIFAGTAMLVGASLLLVARFLVARRKGAIFV